MATQPRTFLSPEQYLEIERAAEVRSEYLNGEMFAMSGASFRHSMIVNNLAAIMRAQVRGRCNYAATDLRLVVPATGLYTYPDLMVICGAVEFESDRQDVVKNPQFIVEVLSPSTASYDRGEKFLHYRSIPTLYDYVIVAQDSAHVEHYKRQADNSWLLREYTSLEDIFHIDSIRADIALSAVYEV
jgi:Uma2 family endonuclease